MNNISGGLSRRDMLVSTLASSCFMAGPGLAADMERYDPQNPDLLFGTVSSIWGNDVETVVTHAARLRFQGLEFFRRNVLPYVDSPAHFVKLYHRVRQANLAFIDVANGGPGMADNFIDPTKTPKTIEEHVAFARDLLAPTHCDVWKITMGGRPADNIMTDDHLKTLADALNKIGEQTIKHGIRLAPHPHVWGPLEREHEIRRMFELTDPKYVWWTADTGHLLVGGMDPVKMINDYFTRLAQVHLKDAPGKYKNNKSTPTRAENAKETVFRNLGKGVIDFPALFKVLRDRHFKGWVTFDLDPDDPNADDSYITAISYLRTAVGLKWPPPRA
jgi:inosose dehydratase